MSIANGREALSCCGDAHWWKVKRVGSQVDGSQQIRRTETRIYTHRAAGGDRGSNGRVAAGPATSPESGPQGCFPLIWLSLSGIFLSTVGKSKCLSVFLAGTLRRGMSCQGENHGQTSEFHACLRVNQPGSRSNWGNPENNGSGSG